MSNDLQTVAVVQNGEKLATLKTGRTGGLPYTGTGWYRTNFDTVTEKSIELLFDGAMSRTCTCSRENLLYSSSHTTVKAKGLKSASIAL